LRPHGFGGPLGMNGFDVRLCLNGFVQVSMPPQLPTQPSSRTSGCRTRTAPANGRCGAFSADR
jgi:hypothetical protein